MAKINDWEKFANTLKDFAWLEKERISGSDIDWIREKKGKVIMLEGKRVQDNEIKIKYAQFRLMRELVRGRGLAYFVGTNDKNDEIYVIDVNTIENRHFHYDEKHELVKKISLIDTKTILKHEFALQIKKQFADWGVF